MSEQSVQEILKRVDALAAKLGVTAEYLWGVLVKQARIEIVEDLLFVVIVAVGTWLWVRLGLSRRTTLYNNESTIKYDGKSEMTGYGLLYAIGSVVVGIFLLAAMLMLLHLPTLIFNPEYWALKQLLK